MSRNNDVFQILVTKGNQAVLPAGANVGTLAIGQIGVFDASTHESLDGSKATKEFYLAVGMDKDGDTVMDDINTSAGQLIQTNNMRFFSFRPHTAPRPMIVELSDLKAGCETDYALKLEFRNSVIYRRQGYNQFSHAYTVRTAPCDDCAECATGNCGDLVKRLLEAINADEKGLITATAYATVALTAATHGVAADLAIGDVVSAADLDAVIAYNEGVADKADAVCVGVRMTTVPMAIEKFCSINTKYHGLRQTVVIPSLVEGFGVNGTLTITQEAAFEEGNGYDVRQKEYHAGNWNGSPGPYKVNVATGLATDGFEYNADASVKYDQFALTYDQSSVAGWAEHLNNLATEIAIPAADTVTRNGLATVLDALFASAKLGFDALADDVALANVSETVVEPTEDIDDVDGDGIA
mgnify:CR=1 FL=1